MNEAVERVLALLPDHRQHGNYWKAKCPAHPDKQPSLAIKETPGGGCFVKCHAGCDKDAVLAALGLTLPDLMPPKQFTPSAARSRQERAYDYTDETGTLLYQAVRMVPKAFRQRRPARPDDSPKERQEGWAWNLNGTRRVLYRLSDVIRAVADSTRVWIVEGEKDATCLVEAGLVATTNAMGAEKWTVPEYSEALRGANVVIIPDNDDSGRRHVRQVGESLKGKAASVRVLELPNLPPKGDVSDFLESGATVDELIALADTAPSFEEWEKTGKQEKQEGNQVPESASWEEPVPFGVQSAIPFPAEAISGWLGTYVRAVAMATQTPLDLAGVLSLAVLAAALQGRVVIEGNPGWREQVMLYTGVVLPPATRKSAVVSLLVAPLLLFESEQQKERAPKRAEEETERRILEGRLKDAEQRAVKEKDVMEREAAREDAKALAKELGNHQVVGEYHLFTEDFTPERLPGLMADNDGRIAVISAEGDSLHSMSGRYSDKSPNLLTFKKGYDGEPLRTGDRVSRAREYIESPALTLGVAFQPSVLRDLFKVPALRGEGVLARFLFSQPETNIGYRQINPPPVPESVALSYAAHVMTLLNFPKLGECGPIVLRLSPDAKARFDVFQHETEEKLRPGGVLSGLADWGGKRPGTALRIAALLHVAQNYVETGTWSLTVTEDSIHRALALCDYFESHARNVFAYMGGDANSDNARELLDWLRRTNKVNFSEAEVWANFSHGGHSGRFEDRESIVAALTILSDRHFIRLMPSQARTGPGRKRSPQYEVNPQAYQYESPNSSSIPIFPIQLPGEVNKTGQIGILEDSRHEDASILVRGDKKIVEDVY
jgi:5S rRNA maturation endonuclease (ribonuclease M5)